MLKSIGQLGGRFSQLPPARGALCPVDHPGSGGGHFSSQIEAGVLRVPRSDLFHSRRRSKISFATDFVDGDLSQTYVTSPSYERIWSYKHIQQIRLLLRSQCHSLHTFCETRAGGGRPLGPMHGMIGLRLL
eukprot:550472-Pyramimonas_sp.AAC.1